MAKAPTRSAGSPPIAGEARELDKIEKRFILLEERSKENLTALNMLRELYAKLPPEASLTSFSFEDPGQVLIRGQAPMLNKVFECVSNLKGSQILKGFEIKVRYATQRDAPEGTITDFEIICSLNPSS